MNDLNKIIEKMIAKGVSVENSVEKFPVEVEKKK